MIDFSFFFAVCLIGALLVRLCVCAFVRLCLCAFVRLCFIVIWAIRTPGHTEIRTREDGWGCTVHHHENRTPTNPLEKKNPQKTKSKLGKYQTETTRTERKFLCVLKKKKKNVINRTQQTKKGKINQKKRKKKKPHEAATNTRKEAVGCRDTYISTVIGGVV